MSGGPTTRTAQLAASVNAPMKGMTDLKISPKQSTYHNALAMQSLNTPRDESSVQVETPNRKRQRSEEITEVNAADKKTCYNTPYTHITEYEAPWYRGYQTAVKNEGNYFLSQADIAKTIPGKNTAQNAPPLGTTPHYATGIQLFADGNYNLKGLFNFFKRKICPDTINALRRRNSFLPVYVYRGDQRLRNQLAHLRGTVVDLSGADLSSEKQLTERLNRKTQQDLMV